MSTPTVERTGDWDSVPFSGGYAGLRELADDEFSGTVTAGPARLFMLRGSVIGILDGEIEDFEGAGGTAREAPHPALPLLAVMQERSDEVRAEYYTEETPISEVDRTLADGNFTGYIELAENVLSGDYYQVYHQGHSMSVAYVGASERLIEDEEAFEQADDEVGIYEVRPVDIEVIEVPEPEDDDGGGAAGAATGGGAAGGAAGAADSETTSAGGETDSAGDETESAAGKADEDTVVEDAESGSTGDESATSADESSVAADESDERASTGDDVEDRSDDGSAAGGTAESVDSSDADAATDGTSAAETTSGAADGAAERSSASSAEASDGSASTGTGGDSAAGTGGESAAGGAGSDGNSGGSARTASSSGTASGDTPQSEASDGPSSGSAANGGVDASSGRSGRASAGTSGDPAGSGGSSQQGRPAPDHPAAGGRRSAESSPSGGESDGALAPGDLEMRSLPSLDPERTASASRQERARRSSRGAAAGATATGDESSRDAAAGAGQGDSESAGPQRAATADAEPAPQDGTRSPDAGDESASADTRAAEGATGAESAGAPSADATGEAADDGGADDGAADADGATEDASASADGTEAADASATADATAATGDLEEARAEVERLESELEDLRENHEDVTAERDRLESELAEAREEIDRLRERLEDATGMTGEAATKLSPREAIDETNLFIRYDSKGEATLEKAHEGEVGKAAVDENMRLEYHTSFDADDASVDGVGFDQFLTDTVQYRFVDWLVRTLLYEIRDTGNTGPMSALYDALPKADRAELNGQVGVRYTEDGQEVRSQLGFDVIVRNRMGNPLIVANLNDSRDPATDSMMTDLVRAAERVGESSQSLAGAFLVTRSFFEPEALETAEEATAGGLLNRGKQKSFVNLSRKGGYHLCLVEARNQEFHLAVPEL